MEVSNNTDNDVGMSNGDQTQDTQTSAMNDNNANENNNPTTQQQQQQEQQKIILVNVPALPRAAELLFASNADDKKMYWDRSFYESPDAQMRALAKSSTLYIGNLAFSTRSMHVRAHFSQIGPVKMVQMGLDRYRKTPCGFCFVEYYQRSDALYAVANLSGTKLDGQVIRVELDAGFRPGRQYGRGKLGGQVREDRRARADPRRNKQGSGGPAAPPPPTTTKLNWIPPDQVRAEEANNNSNNNNNTASGDKDSYYGPVKSEDDNGGGGGDADMDVPEKNPRFREE